MSMALWLKRQDDPTAADEDRLYLFKEFERLDAICEDLGVVKLSTFFDYTEANAEVSDEEVAEDRVEQNEQWHEPADLLSVLNALHARLSHSSQSSAKGKKIDEAVMEEIDTLIPKIASAIESKAKVHLCLVM